MVVRLFVFAVTLIALGSVQAAPIQWKTADGGNDHWYEVFSAPGISWTNAAAAASASGGYLATILSQQENDFIFGLADAPEFWVVTSDVNIAGPWLGGFQPDGSIEPDGGWEWLNSDGGFGVEDVGAYTNWHPPINGSFQEPNNFMDRPENAVQFYSYDAVAPPAPSSFWNDEVGSSSMSGGYVVESLVPEPTTSVLAMLGIALASVSRRRPRRRRKT